MRRKKKRRKRRRREEWWLCKFTCTSPCSVCVCVCVCVCVSLVVYVHTCYYIHLDMMAINVFGGVSVEMVHGIVIGVHLLNNWMSCLNIPE